VPDLLLQVWKLVLVGFIYLFFLRVLRAIWANLRAPATAGGQAAKPAPRAGGAQSSSAPTGNEKGINRLKLIEPKDRAGRIYELGSEITIGRAPGCKVNIDDTYVSQLHARVFRRDSQVLLEDLGSTNGTFCNGKKVSGPMPVRKGDRIQVGRTVLEAVR
jgi:pSer/pThr/pTyr-binding forkhead associated (FHA) protein